MHTVKLSVFMLLAAFIILVHRRARIGFVIAYCAAAYVFLCASGCATERASPGSAPTGNVCGEHDGSYILINCKRYFP